MEMDLPELLRAASDFDVPPERTRLLIVDDEASIQAVFKALFAPQGYQLSHALSAEYAIPMLEEQPRVALVDKNLPGISGLEFIRSAKATHPDTEYIMMTAYGSMDSAIEALDLGAFGFLLKPFPKIDDVVARVEAALERNRVVLQNRMLLERLKGAYDALYTAKVEIELTGTIVEEKLKQRDAQIREVVQTLISPLAALETDVQTVLADVAGTALTFEDERILALLTDVKRMANNVAGILTQSASLADRLDPDRKASTPPGA